MDSHDYYHIPIPHRSQRTISFGRSESSFLHLMQIMSVVVSSTIEWKYITMQAGGNTLAYHCGFARMQPRLLSGRQR